MLNLTSQLFIIMQLSVLFDGVSMWIVADTEAVNHKTARTCIYQKYTLFIVCILYFRVQCTYSYILSYAVATVSARNTAALSFYSCKGFVSSQYFITVLCARVHIRVQRFYQLCWWLQNVTPRNIYKRSLLIVFWLLLLCAKIFSHAFFLD
jgi:hypothetical protein